MNVRAWVFLAIAVAGLGTTQYYLARFIDEVQGQPFLEGFLAFDVGAFLAGGFANPAASFLSIDVIVAAACFLIWMFPEAKKLGMRRAWIYAVLVFAVALAFALPLFMLMRERALLRAARA